MFGENFLIAGVLVTVASLIAFVLEKSTIKDFLEIGCAFCMFFYVLSVCDHYESVLYHSLLHQDLQEVGCQRSVE